MALNPEEEILRAEALKFFDQVQTARASEHISPNTEPSLRAQHRSPETRTQAVFVVQEAVKEEFRRFLHRLRDRFAGDTHSTHRKFLQIISGTTRDQFWLSEVYTKICNLLVGHTDLFYEFERFLNIGSAESNREIENLRVRVRQDFVREFDAVLGNFQSVTERMEEIQRRNEAPGRITGLQAQYIDKALFSDDADPLVKWEMMIDLLMEPRSYCEVVVPCLDNKQKMLRLMYAFVTGYFDQISSFPISSYHP